MLAYKPIPVEVTSPYDRLLEARMNAYEIVMNQRCNYLRRYIPAKGWLQQIEETVARKSSSGKFKPLVQANMLHYSWELFVVDHPHLFSKKCVDRARYRLVVLPEAELKRARVNQYVERACGAATQQAAAQ